MSIFYIVEFDAQVQVLSKVIGNQVEVLVTSNSDKKLHFACYFLINGKVVSKSHYNHNGIFNFSIDKSANISIRLYIREVVNDIRLSKSIDLGSAYVESEYTSKVLSKLISLQNAELGKSLCTENKLKFPNFSEVKLKGSDFYNIDPFGNRTWRWCLQQLAHLPYVISYHEFFSKDVIVLHYILEYIHSWKIYSQSEVASKDQMLWHDHATALRLRNLNLSFCYLMKKGGISALTIDYRFMLDLIKLHIDKLMENDFYSEYTNHGFDQSLFLYQTALEFQYLLPELDRVIEVAERRLINEINYAFCIDGGHKENSPAYLNFGIKQCLMAIEIASSYERMENLEYVKKVLERATVALTYTVKPDGDLPLVGDTSRYKLFDFFNEFKPSTYGEFRYALTKGKSGNKPKSNKLILSETGYAYYRSHWELVGFSNAIHLGFKASYHSNYHRHDDDLSITLYAYGQDWLIDGGIYKYDEKDLHRRYIRSHLSHNILSVENTLALRDRNNRHEVYLKDLCQVDNDNFHVLGVSKMFKDYVNSREIQVLEKDTFIIKDKCENIFDKKFNATSRLFFSSSIEIEIQDHKIIAKGALKQLHIIVSSQTEIFIKLVSNPKEKIIGWLSDSTNTLIHTNLVEISTLRNANAVVDIEMKFVFI